MKIKSMAQVAFYLLAGLNILYGLFPRNGSTGTYSMNSTTRLPTPNTAGIVRIPTSSAAEDSSTPPVKQGLLTRMAVSFDTRKRRRVREAEHRASCLSGSMTSCAKVRLPAEDLIGGDEAWGDINGVARISAAVDTYASTLSCLWWWYMLGVYLFYGIYGVGLLYTATLPLRYGDVGTRPYETMSYFRRLMAVTSLFAVSGGATFMFLFADVHIGSWVWTTWGTSDCFVATAFLALFNFTFMGPLPHRFPSKEFLRSKLFALWREYFDFKAVNEFGEVMDVDNLPKDKQYLLAQLPHGVMPFGAMLGSSMLPELLPNLWPASGVVATALMLTPVLRTFINYLGVRKAGTASIHQMFADGFKAVGVVTGGIAEMYVSRRNEVLACLRKGFGHIAIKGGHDIIPVYVFGASLTHSVFPWCNNWVGRALSRKCKAPVLLFWGAWGFVPHRQQLKMVIGRPVGVKKQTEGVTSEDALAVCSEVQDSVVDIYDRQKPFWEVRPISFDK